MSQINRYFKTLLQEYTHLFKEARNIELQKSKQSKNIHTNSFFISSTELPFIQKLISSIEEFLLQEQRIQHFFKQDMELYKKYSSFSNHLRILHNSKKLHALEHNLKLQKDTTTNEELDQLLKEEEHLITSINKQILSSAHIEDILVKKEKRLIQSFQNIRKKCSKSMILIPSLILVIISSQMIQAHTEIGDDGLVPVIEHYDDLHFEKSEVVEELDHVEIAKNNAFNTLKEFRQTGAATVYGKMFDGRPAFNGSTFHHTDLTCALPLGTPFVKRARFANDPVLVRITNLENGKSLIVPVTDVGNFGYNMEKKSNNKYRTIEIYKRTSNGKIATHTNGNAVFETVDRIVDISRGVAYELGMIPKEQVHQNIDIFRSAKVSVEIVKLPDWIKEHI